MTVHVCPIKDSECGHRPDNWCDDCPLRAAAPQAPRATLRHDAGAYAQCHYCKRYSLDPTTLTDWSPACECGKRHGWSGSFKPPGSDAKWSGAAPQAQPAPAGYCARASAGVIECLCAESEQRGCAEWRSYHAQPAPAEPIHVCPTCNLAGQAIADERDAWRVEALRLRARSHEPAPAGVLAVMRAVDALVQSHADAWRSSKRPQDRACDPAIRAAYLAVQDAAKASARSPGPAPVSDDLLPLQRFADAMMEGWREGSGIDGCELQDIAEACGLLKEFQTTAPCGDECACADAGIEGETQCYRVQPVALRAMKASIAHEAGRLAERGRRHDRP